MKKVLSPVCRFVIVFCHPPVGKTAVLTDCAQRALMVCKGGVPMMNYETALKKARRLKPNIDHCTEYEKAYSFSSRADEFTFGGDGPVVILKASGRAINFIDFLESPANDGKPHQEFSV